MWTEQRTDTEILKKGTILTHASDKKIKSFKNIETCFYKDINKLSYEQNWYQIELLQDIQVDCYGRYERRFTIEKNVNCKIKYIGKY